MSIRIILVLLEYNYVRGKNSGVTERKKFVAEAARGSYRRGLSYGQLLGNRTLRTEYFADYQTLQTISDRIRLFARIDGLEKNRHRKTESPH